MSRKEAEELLELYKSALFSKFKDWGDHPSQTSKIDIALTRIEEEIIRQLTDSRMPVG